MKSVKVSCDIIVTLLSLGCILSGCGSEAKKENYITPEGLDGVSAIFITADQLSAETPEEEERVINVISEATGDEETTARSILQAADIYNHPSSDASKLGTVSRGSTIPVIGLLEGGEWYKVNYNGRVAYIAASAVAGTGRQENIVSQTVTPSPAPTASDEPSEASEASDVPTISPRPSASTSPARPQTSSSPARPSTSTPPSNPSRPQTSSAPSASASPGSSAAPDFGQDPSPGPSSDPGEEPSPSTGPGEQATPAPSEEPGPSSTPGAGEEPTPTPSEEPTPSPDVDLAPGPSTDPGPAPSTEPSQPEPPVEPEQTE